MVMRTFVKLAFSTISALCEQTKRPTRTSSPKVDVRDRSLTYGSPKRAADMMIGVAPAFELDLVGAGDGERCLLCVRSRFARRN